MPSRRAVRVHGILALAAVALAMRCSARGFAQDPGAPCDEQTQQAVNDQAGQVVKQAGSTLLKLGATMNVHLQPCTNQARVSAQGPGFKIDAQDGKVNVTRDAGTQTGDESAPAGGEGSPAGGSGSSPGMGGAPVSSGSSASGGPQAAANPAQSLAPALPGPVDPGAVAGLGSENAPPPSGSVPLVAGPLPTGRASSSGGFAANSPAPAVERSPASPPSLSPAVSGSGEPSRSRPGVFEEASAGPNPSRLTDAVRAGSFSRPPGKVESFGPAARSAAAARPVRYAAVRTAPGQAGAGGPPASWIGSSRGSSSEPAWPQLQSRAQASAQGAGPGARAARTSDAGSEFEEGLTNALAISGRTVADAASALRGGAASALRSAGDFILDPKNWMQGAQAEEADGGLDAKLLRGVEARSAPVDARTASDLASRIPGGVRFNNLGAIGEKDARLIMGLAADKGYGGIDLFPKLALGAERDLYLSPQVVDAIYRDFDPHLLGLPEGRAKNGQAFRMRAILIRRGQVISLYDPNEFEFRNPGLKKDFIFKSPVIYTFKNESEMQVENVWAKVWGAKVQINRFVNLNNGFVRVETNLGNSKEPLQNIQRRTSATQGAKASADGAPARSPDPGSALAVVAAATLAGAAGAAFLRGGS